MEYTKDELEFLVKNYETRGIKFCANHLNRTCRSVSYCANKKLGLYRNSWKSKFCLKKVENIENGETAYVLGFLWADGFVGKKSVGIELDLNDLLEVKPIFDSVMEWKFYTRKREYSATGELRKNSKEICQFLSSLGYKDKSIRFSKEIIESIPKNLIKYFLRGFLDGDGNITPEHYSVRFCGPINYDWTEIENLLKVMGVKSRINKSSSINENTGNLNSYSFLIVSGKSNFLKFLTFIYDERDTDNIGLTRKFNKYQEALNRIRQTDEKKKTQ